MSLGKIQGKIYNCAYICAKYNLNKQKRSLLILQMRRLLLAQKWNIFIF